MNKISFRSIFSGIRGKIVLANSVGLIVFLAGALTVNFSRQSLLDMRVNSLIEQADMLVAALTDGPEAGRNPERILKGVNGVFLRPPIIPEDMRALLFSKKGKLLEDSDTHPPGAVKEYPLPLKPTISERKRKLQRMWISVSHRLTGEAPPIFEEADGRSVKDFPEVKKALKGEKVGVIRLNKRGEFIMSVAVPVRRLQPVLGALHLSVSGDEIAEIMREDRHKILNLFAVALLTSVIVSLLLARGIAQPLRHLSRAARRYELKSFARDGRLSDEKAPDFTARRDEIGSLARSLRKMLRGLEHRVKEADAFAAEVSHELKNPLTSLKSALETEEKVSDPEKKKRLREIMRHDIRRIDRLIGDISGVSRLEGEMMRETDAAVNLTSLLANLVTYYREVGAEEHIPIEHDFSGKDIYIFGLAERLGQIFRNLLDNAVSFTPSGKTVRVSLTRSSDGEIAVSVSDQGPGLPAEVIEKIFERFYSHRPTAPKFGNHSGLGLAIAKKITEAHDGRIFADNILGENGMIEGARFTVIFPKERVLRDYVAPVEKF